MLATLERPSTRSVGPIQPPGPDRSKVAATQPKRRTLLLPPPTDSVPALVPLLPAVSDGRAWPLRPSARPSAAEGESPDRVTRPARAQGPRPAVQPTRLRTTVRARRLLAGLALLCSVGVGVVAVDVLSAVVPFMPASYTAQSAPYDGSSEGAVGSAGLVPAAGSTVVVAEGDTLWSVAQRVAPDADPRTVIAAIMTVNGLESPSIQAGQVLRLP